MWFRERALVAVDSRGVAVAVYRESFSGARLLRFAFERSSTRRGADGSLLQTLAAAGEAVKRLAHSVRAPSTDATFLLPIGATFPSITDPATVSRAQAADVDETDFVRFRFASVLPFPVSQAEVRTEAMPSLGPGLVLAQAVLKSTVAAAEEAMEAWGFPKARISSALSLALHGLPPRAGVVDLILGDAACAVCTRDAHGVAEAMHLRLLAEGDDRARRSIDEARRAAPAARQVRVLGEDVSSRVMSGAADASSLVPAFAEGARIEGADPQSHPFLALFHAPTRGARATVPDFGSHAAAPGSGVWAAVRVAGLAVLAYAVAIAAIEGRAAYLSGEALNHTRAEVARAGRAADDIRKAVQKSPDVLAMVASLESSPARVRLDLDAVRPAGVRITSLKIDYASEGLARLDLGVMASSSESYDLFLSALARSPRFSDIKPGSEVRPGLVRANVTVVHRPDKGRP